MLQPLAKRILIKPIESQKKQSVLILKDQTPQTFKVIAIGDEVKKVNIDDTIFLASYSTSEITFEGETFTLVNEDNIIAKVI